MDHASGIRAGRNGDDGGGGVRQQRGADKHRHPVVHRRDGEVEYVNTVVAAAVVVRAGRRIVGVRGNAAVDDEQVADGGRDSRRAVGGAGG